MTIIWKVQFAIAKIDKAAHQASEVHDRTELAQRRAPNFVVVAASLGKAQRLNASVLNVEQNTWKMASFAACAVQEDENHIAPRSPLLPIPAIHL
eukprot:m.110738 g.110738  ORF g.110738 m.110738 type:complete len:95 (+) comp15275_c0_seq1:1114-1398(+)